MVGDSPKILVHNKVGHCSPLRKACSSIAAGFGDSQRTPMRRTASRHSHMEMSVDTTWALAQHLTNTMCTGRGLTSKAWTHASRPFDMPGSGLFSQNCILERLTAMSSTVALRQRPTSLDNCQGCDGLSTMRGSQISTQVFYRSLLYTSISPCRLIFTASRRIWKPTYEHPFRAHRLISQRAGPISNPSGRQLAPIPRRTDQPGYTGTNGPHIGGSFEFSISL